MSSENVAFELEQSQGIGLRSITQKVNYSDFVDSTSTYGSMTLSARLSSYSFPVACKVKINTGFSGDTTAVMRIGLANIAAPTGITDSTTGCIDYDVISASTSVNVLTAAKTYTKFADFTDSLLTSQDSSQLASPTVANENYIMVSVTGAADFTSITAGEAIITVYYFSTITDAGSYPSVP